MALTSDCNKSFCSNFMLLHPEKASLMELLKMLFSSDIGKRKFVDCHADADTEESLAHRWIIINSVLAQKFLLAAAEPIAAAGAGIEHWLNLLSQNGGFFRLTANFLKGKVVQPDTESAQFTSFIGNLDKRVDLGTEVDPRDPRYYVTLSIMAAKASYENKNSIRSIVTQNWKMDFLGSYDYWNDYKGKASTQAFLMDNKNNKVVVAFRGTEPFNADDWSSDFDISWYELPKLGRVHGGFMKALGLQVDQGWPRRQKDGKTQTAYYAIREALKEQVGKNKKVRFVVTGHSLGGALAVLFPAVLALHKESNLLRRLEGVYTYGQPRVGDDKFMEFMSKAMKKYKFNYFRMVYSFDMVPRLPYDDHTMMFKHFGTCIYFNSNYQGKVVAEEPDKNYFSILWWIPKFVNACWELIRSFMIPYTRGAEFREGGLTRIFRVIGLFAAGVPAHCPQDYVNSTRLASSLLFVPSHTHKLLKTN